MSTIQQLLTEHFDIWTSADNAKKAGRGRNSSNADKIYGIKKLRELILELAVRGKLVPQDPNDEPASELLKRIRKEKAKLIAEGKIKKEKPLPAITEEEKPFELPKGWEWVRLGYLMEMYNGRAFKSSEWKSNGIPIVRIQNLNDCTASFNYFSGKLDEQHKIGNGTFLISWSGTPGTSFGAFLWNRGDAALNQHINKCNIFSNELDKNYLLIAINSCMSYLIMNAQGGVGLKHVTKDVLNNMIFCLPPIEEQLRIVTRVSELTALCDQLETQHNNSVEAYEKLVTHFLNTLTQSKGAEEFNENWQRITKHFDILFTTESSVDALKQTLLQLAVMGKLVPQDPNDEPASELLKRIQKEKAKLIAEGKLKKEKPLEPITEDEKSFELPMGWEWVRMADICLQITDGTHQTPKYVTDGRPFLSAQNVKPFKFMPADYRCVSQNDFDSLRRNRVPERGDILLTRVGAMIGEAAVIDSDFEFAFYVSLALLKLSRQTSISNFIVLWLNSPLGTSISVKNTLGRGVSAGNLNLSLIRNFLIGLPPVAEQNRMIVKIEELMLLCDQLKNQFTTQRDFQRKIADEISQKYLN